jgi:mannose-6-phosphate isomerase-like protein (cupin superfamily)
MLTHPAVIRPADHAEWRSDKMGKSTIYESARLLVGLNALEPGQSHMLHAHAGIDKMYYVVDGEGMFLLEGRDLPMQAGDLLVAPDGATRCQEHRQWTSARAGRPRSSAVNAALKAPGVGCEENVKLCHKRRAVPGQRWPSAW